MERPPRRVAEVFFGALGGEPVRNPERKEWAEVCATRTVLKMNEPSIESHAQEARSTRRLIQNWIAAERTTLPVFDEWIGEGFEIEP